jgi:hypothetical protein
MTQPTKQLPHLRLGLDTHAVGFLLYPMPDYDNSTRDRGV